MSKNTCGYCMFKIPIKLEPTDILWCWKKKQRKDIMDPGCAAFKKELKFQELFDHHIWRTNEP